MKIIITAKSEDLDKTVDVVLDISSELEEKGYKVKGCRCMKDGTSIILDS